MFGGRFGALEPELYVYALMNSLVCLAGLVILVSVFIHNGGDDRFVMYFGGVL